MPDPSDLTFRDHPITLGEMRCIENFQRYRMVEDLIEFLSSRAQVMPEIIEAYAADQMGELAEAAMKGVQQATNWGNMRDALKDVRLDPDGNAD